MISPDKVGQFLEDQSRTAYPEALYVGKEYVHELLRVFLARRPDDDNTPSSAVAFTMLRDEFKMALMFRNKAAGFDRASQMQTFQGYLDLIGNYVLASIQFAEQTVILPDIDLATLIPHFDSFQEEVKWAFSLTWQKERPWIDGQMTPEVLHDGRQFVQRIGHHLATRNNHIAYNLGLKIAHDTFGLYVSMILALLSRQFDV